MNGTFGISFNIFTYNFFFSLNLEWSFLPLLLDCSPTSRPMIRSLQNLGLFYFAYQISRKQSSLAWTEVCLCCLVLLFRAIIFCCFMGNDPHIYPCDHKVCLFINLLSFLGYVSLYLTSFQKKCYSFFRMRRINLAFVSLMLAMMGTRGV